MSEGTYIQDKRDRLTAFRDNVGKNEHIGTIVFQPGSGGECNVLGLPEEHPNLAHEVRHWEGY